MINCLLTVAQCTLITNHSAAENGIFQQNDLHLSSTILLMEDKRIPKKLEKAEEDSNEIPSVGSGGCQGRSQGPAEPAGLSPGTGLGWAPRLLREGKAETLCCGISPDWV